VTDRLRKWLDKPYSEMSLGEIGDRDFNALAALRAVVELALPTRHPKYHPEYTLAMLHVLSAIEKEVLK
jgi:hypothetical protein